MEGTMSDSLPGSSSSQTENSLLCKLIGNSISGFVEIDSWSRRIPLKFFNINDTTRLRDMVDKNYKITDKAHDELSEVISLKDVKTFLDKPKMNTKTMIGPVCVHVVAKKEVEMKPKDRQLVVVPIVVVADTSGFCTLCSLNEGVKTIYDAVDVGDVLLITRFLPQKSMDDSLRRLFDTNMFIDMELKVAFHSVRQHYVRKHVLKQSVYFLMPKAIISETNMVILPSDIEKLYNVEAQGTIFPALENYYNILGVVSYVGRVERTPTDCVEVDCLEDEKLVTKTIQRYSVYRWIYLIDRLSPPVPVKIFINNLNHRVQEAFIPGAIIAISHCKTVYDPSVGFQVTTSAYSQQFLDEQLLKFLMIHPAECRDRFHELMSRTNYIDVISRNDVSFSAGGTHSSLIPNHGEFLDWYYKHLHKHRSLPCDRPISQRETIQLTFEGMIVKASLFDADHFPKPFFVRKPHFTRLVVEKRSRFTVIENFNTLSSSWNASWYFFQRKLPRIDPTMLAHSKCRHIVKGIVGSFKPIIRLLGVSSELVTANENQNQTRQLNSTHHLECEKLNGEPYIILDVVNEDALQWYTLIWKTPAYSISDKVAKVQSAINKEIVCSAYVHCRDVAVPNSFEVVLQDFVLVDETMIT